MAPLLSFIQSSIVEWFNTSAFDSLSWQLQLFCMALDLYCYNSSSSWQRVLSSLLIIIACFCPNGAEIQGAQACVLLVVLCLFVVLSILCLLQGKLAVYTAINLVESHTPYKQLLLHTKQLLLPRLVDSCHAYFRPQKYTARDYF
jgi:hypothetical protein